MIRPSFSIIGTGFILERHIKAIRASGGVIADVVNNFNGQNNAWINMIMKTQASHVVILTPNIMHFDMALMARRFDKTVLCEKPLAVTSEQVKMLSELDKVYTVLQLRHHSLVEEIKKIKGKVKIGMDISVYRDDEYFASWKGSKILSGGILFNLGIHYFDLLLHIFGSAKKAKLKYCDEKVATGTIEGENYICEWKLSTMQPKEHQHRVFTIGKKEFNFSSKDNLSQEDLHIQVYKDLVQGKGVTPADVLPVTELIEKMYFSKK